MEHTLKLEFVTDWAAHEAPGPFVNVTIGENTYPLIPHHWERIRAMIDAFFADPTKKPE